MDSTITCQAALKGFFEIIEDWNLDLKDAQKILGNIDKQEVNQYKRAPEINLEEEIMERISIIYGINKAVSVLFPSKQKALHWFCAENQELKRKPPIKLIRSGSVQDLYCVLYHLNLYRF